MTGDYTPPEETELHFLSQTIDKDWYSTVISDIRNHVGWRVNGKLVKKGENNILLPPQENELEAREKQVFNLKFSWISDALEPRELKLKIRADNMYLIGLVNRRGRYQFMGEELVSNAVELPFTGQYGMLDPSGLLRRNMTIGASALTTALHTVEAATNVKELKKVLVTLIFHFCEASRFSVISKTIYQWFDRQKCLNESHIGVVNSWGTASKAIIKDNVNFHEEYIKSLHDAKKKIALLKIFSRDTPEYDSLLKKIHEFPGGLEDNEESSSGSGSGSGCVRGDGGGTSRGEGGGTSRGTTRGGRRGTSRGSESKELVAGQSYLIGCDNELAKINTCSPSSCDKVGGVIITHIRDLKRFAMLWLCKTEEVRADMGHWAKVFAGDYEAGWTSEMFGYSFAAAEMNLRHVISNEILIYPGYVHVPGIKYKVFHYVRVGNWSFDKAKWRHMDVANKCWAKFPDPPDSSTLNHTDEDSLSRDLLSIECANSLNETLERYYEKKMPCPQFHSPFVSKGP